MRAICIYNYAWFSMIYLHFTPSSAKSGHVLWKPLTVLGFLCMFLHETASSTHNAIASGRHWVLFGLLVVQSEAASDYLHRCRSLFQKLIPDVWVVVSVSKISLFFVPYLGKSIQCVQYFSDGLVQPPTSSLQIFLCCVKQQQDMVRTEKKARVAAFQFGGFWEHEFLVLFLPPKTCWWWLVSNSPKYCMSLWKNIHVYVDGCVGLFVCEEATLSQ